MVRINKSIKNNFLKYNNCELKIKKFNWTEYKVCREMKITGAEIRISMQAE